MAKKILVVDDELNLLRMVESRLKANGYEVVTAGNGKEALEKTKSEKPDLILMDIIMPVMSGEEALKRLRQDEATRSIPVIMLTAKGEPDDIVKNIICGGAKDYIVKPFVAVDFIKKVNDAVKGDRELPGACEFLLDTIEEKIKKTFNEKE